jgi:hypothetical protein
VLLLGLRARDSGFSMVHGRQPRLWPGPDGSGGLAALEHRWQALWSHQCARQSTSLASYGLGSPIRTCVSKPLSLIDRAVIPLTLASAPGFIYLFIIACSEVICSPRHCHFAVQYIPVHDPTHRPSTHGA